MKKLGTIVTDSVTKLEGMLLNTLIDMNKQVQYLFQPKALNPKTGLPVDKFWVTESRILNGIDIEINIPYNVLGTFVEDTATGFSGIATGIVLHINGCMHIEVKSDKILADTGTVGKGLDVDIRRLKGEFVPVLTETEMEVSRKEIPSPEDIPDRYKEM